MRHKRSWNITHWLIHYLLRPMCCFIISFFVAGMFVAGFKWREYFVWLRYDYFSTFSTLIYSLLVYICMLFLFICIIAASIFVAIFIRSECFFMIQIWISSYIQFTDCFFTFLYLSVISYHLNKCSMYFISCSTKKILLYVYGMIIIIYLVHWLIFHLLSSVFFSFHVSYCSLYVIVCFYRSNNFI